VTVDEESWKEQERKGNRKRKKVVRKKNNIFLSGRIKIGHCRREKDVN
tara:strand:+ start:268 stop:411 length:144 start_codon:yes stop_codon:yes gene_type:complete